MASSLSESVNQYVDRSAEILDLEGYIRTLLADPYRQIDVQVPVHADNGSVRTFRGYRVQHNGARSGLVRHRSYPRAGREARKRTP